MVTESLVVGASKNYVGIPRNRTRYINPNISLSLWFTAYYWSYFILLYPISKAHKSIFFGNYYWLHVRFCMAPLCRYFLNKRLTHFPPLNSVSDPLFLYLLRLLTRKKKTKGRRSDVEREVSGTNCPAQSHTHTQAFISLTLAEASKWLESSTLLWKETTVHCWDFIVILMDMKAHKFKIGRKLAIIRKEILSSACVIDTQLTTCIRQRLVWMSLIIITSHVRKFAIFNNDHNDEDWLILQTKMSPKVSRTPPLGRELSPRVVRRR